MLVSASSMDWEEEIEFLEQHEIKEPVGDCVQDDPLCAKITADCNDNDIIGSEERVLSVEENVDFHTISDAGNDCVMLCFDNMRNSLMFSICKNLFEIDSGKSRMLILSLSHGFH